MRPRLALSALLLASMLLGASAPAAGAGQTPGAETGVRSQNALEVAAFLAADTRALDRLWGDGMVVNNPLNAFVTKPQVLAMVDSGMLRFSAFDRRIDYLHLYGNTAIVAGIEAVVWAGRMPLAGKTSHVRFTAVWMRSHGVWREVARHADILPDR